MSLALGLAAFLLLFFVLYLILGAIGLSMLDNEQFEREARVNIMYTARHYDEIKRENIFTLKDLIEKAKVMGRPDTLQADRQKIREALASMKESQGLLGKVGRTEDREAIKPFLFVKAEKGAWTVAHRPN